MLQTTPVYTNEEARTRETFLALMWAMSCPGRAYPLPVAGRAAFYAISETLLDLETSFFTPDFDLASACISLGARPLPPDRAQYHFYPELSRDDAKTLAQASGGSILYPDRAATIVVGCTLGDGMTLALSGPGVNRATFLNVSDISGAFWEQRLTTARYPLGWDAFLVSDGQVIGLPRTTILHAV